MCQVNEFQKIFKANVELPYVSIFNVLTCSLSGSVNVTWQLSVAVFIDAAEDGVTGTLLLSLPQMSHSQKLPIKLSRGLQKVSLPVMSFTSKDDVKPWWPRGYGKPNLYTVKVKII